MTRVAPETIVLDQVSDNGVIPGGLEGRQLLDGTKVAIHKCYFTTERLLAELGGGDILMDGPALAIIKTDQRQEVNTESLRCDETSDRLCAIYLHRLDQVPCDSTQRPLWAALVPEFGMRHQT
jgi:hypothetical protein